MFNSQCFMQILKSLRCLFLFAKNSPHFICSRYFCEPVRLLTNIGTHPLTHMHGRSIHCAWRIYSKYETIQFSMANTIPHETMQFSMANSTSIYTHRTQIYKCQKIIPFISKYSNCNERFRQQKHKKKKSFHFFVTTTIMHRKEDNMCAYMFICTVCTQHAHRKNTMPHFWVLHTQTEFTISNTFEFL